MSIETLDDIIEELADKEGIYGACDNSCEESGRCVCRVAWVPDMKKRILYAVEVEKKLNGGGVISTGFQERVISAGVQSASGARE